MIILRISYLNDLAELLPKLGLPHQNEQVRRTANVVVAIFTAVLPVMAIYAMLYYVMPDNDF